jgi:hypothetical protein
LRGPFLWRLLLGVQCCWFIVRCPFVAESIVARSIVMETIFAESIVVKSIVAGCIVAESIVWVYYCRVHVAQF